MMWNLQNSLAPERVRSFLSSRPRLSRVDADNSFYSLQIFTGHDKGILSVSWCKQDPELLLSCGKDNRTILWNPSTAEMLGEVGLPTSFRLHSRADSLLLL